MKPNYLNFAVVAFVAFSFACAGGPTTPTPTPAPKPTPVVTPTPVPPPVVTPPPPPAKVCDYVLSIGSTINGYPNGGSFPVTVATDAGCNWTANSEASWIYLPPPNISGSGTFTFYVNSNPGSPRTAVLKIAGIVVTFNQTSNAAPTPAPTPNPSPTPSPTPNPTPNPSPAPTPNPGPQPPTCAGPTFITQLWRSSLGPAEYTSTITAAVSFTGVGLWTLELVRDDVSIVASQFVYIACGQSQTLTVNTTHTSSQYGSGQHQYSYRIKGPLSYTSNHLSGY